MHRRLAIAAPLLTLVLLTAACGTGADPGSAPDAGSGTGARPAVVAAFAPLAAVASAVAGPAVDVATLTPPGAEPHDLELSAAQVAQISEADLVLYVKGFQPAVDEAVEQHAADRAIDVSAGLTLRAADDHADEAHGADTHADDHGATDPHVWLDPRNMAAIGRTVADRLATLAPQSDAAARAEAFGTSMTALDADYRAALADCASRTMIVSHEAFGYLADAYGLEQVGIAGITPEAEPSPARLAAVADVVRSSGATTIYSETLMDPRVAQTLADEVGVRTAVLDPIEGIAEGSTYEQLMRANLATLIEGQRCA